MTDFEHFTYGATAMDTRFIAVDVSTSDDWTTECEYSVEDGKMFIHEFYRYQRTIDYEDIQS